MVTKEEKRFEPNFVEVETAEEANNIDLSIYRFERFSDTKNCYIFVKRKGK